MNIGELLSTKERVNIERHDDQYSIRFFVTKKEAGKALKNALGFVERMRKLLEIKNSTGG